MCILKSAKIFNQFLLDVFPLQLEETHVRNAKLFPSRFTVLYKFVEEEKSSLIMAELAIKPGYYAKAEYNIYKSKKSHIFDLNFFNEFDYNYFQQYINKKGIILHKRDLLYY